MNSPVPQLSALLPYQYFLLVISKSRQTIVSVQCSEMAYGVVIWCRNRFWNWVTRIRF